MKKIVSILYFVLGFIFTGFVGKCYPRDFIAGINDLCGDILKLNTEH